MSTFVGNGFVIADGKRGAALTYALRQETIRATTALVGTLEGHTTMGLAHARQKFIFELVDGTRVTFTPVTFENGKLHVSGPDVPPT